MVGTGERREGFGRLLIEIKSRKKLFGEDTVKYSGTMGDLWTVWQHCGVWGLKKPS